MSVSFNQNWTGGDEVDTSGTPTSIKYTRVNNLYVGRGAGAVTSWDVPSGSFYIDETNDLLYVKVGSVATDWVKNPGTADLALKANLASPTFTGTVGLPTVTTGATTFNNVVNYGAIITPAAIGTNQTDYAPTSLSIASAIRQDVSAACVLNSLATTGVGGRRLTLTNISATAANTLTILHDDGATGTAAMRFLCPSNTSLVIPGRGTVFLEYDQAVSRWRVARGY